MLPNEIPQLKSRLLKLAEVLEKSLDIDGILKLAESAPAMEEVSLTAEYTLEQPVRIGVAEDEAFLFLL